MGKKTFYNNDLKFSKSYWLFPPRASIQLLNRKCFTNFDTFSNLSWVCVLWAIQTFENTHKDHNLPWALGNQLFVSRLPIDFIFLNVPFITLTVWLQSFMATFMNTFSTIHLHDLNEISKLFLKLRNQVSKSSQKTREMFGTVDLFAKAKLLYI